MAVSWQWRIAAGRPIDLPVVDLGAVVLVLLPGEAYVEYQLLAQRLRLDATVLALGYGESANGYIPTSSQLAEGDDNLGDLYWVSASAEKVLSDGLRRVLARDQPGRAESPATT